MAGYLRAGKLDRTVTILRRGPEVDDGKQTRPGEWQAFETRLASVKPRIGREAIEAGGREGRTPMSFWFRFDDLTRTLSESDALELDGEHYEIIAPPIRLGRMEGIEVLGSAGGLPE